MQLRQVQNLVLEPLQALLDDPRGLGCINKMYTAFGTTSAEFYESFQARDHVARRAQCQRCQPLLATRQHELAPFTPRCMPLTTANQHARRALHHCQHARRAGADHPRLGWRLRCHRQDTRAHHGRRGHQDGQRGHFAGTEWAGERSRGWK